MRAITWIVLFSPLGVACSHNIYTPPSRPVMLTSPKTVDRGTTALRATANHSSELFGPTLVAGTAGLRHGLQDRLEVVFDTTNAQITENSGAGTNRGIGMARAGVKYRPHESENFALVAGGGAGHSPAAGMYTSADVGLVVGYENRYVVPFVHGGGFASLPLNPKEVNLTAPDDDDEHFDTPEKTVGLSFGAGLRVPLAHDTTSLLVGLSSTQVWDSDSDNGFMSFSGGIETSF